MIQVATLDSTPGTCTKADKKSSGLLVYKALVTVDGATWEENVGDSFRTVIRGAREYCLNEFSVTVPEVGFEYSETRV